jgi:hypothetical protein
MSTMHGGLDCGSLGYDAFIVLKESLGDDMVEEEVDRKWGKTRKKGGNIVMLG